VCVAMWLTWYTQCAQMTHSIKTSTISSSAGKLTMCVCRVCVYIVLYCIAKVLHLAAAVWNMSNCTTVGIYCDISAELKVWPRSWIMTGFKWQTPVSFPQWPMTSQHVGSLGRCSIVLSGSAVLIQLQFSTSVVLYECIFVRPWKRCETQSQILSSH